MYTRMVLMVVFWRYRMPFDAHWRVSMLMKKLIERGKNIDENGLIKMDAFKRLWVWGWS